MKMRECEVDDCTEEMTHLVAAGPKDGSWWIGKGLNVCAAHAKSAKVTDLIDKDMRKKLKASRGLTAAQLKVLISEHKK